VSHGSLQVPYRAAFGGWQYPSYEGGNAPNSVLAYVAFADARNYSVQRLKHGRRWEVRSAEKCFAIRPFSNKAEFQAHAYPLYLEFHNRTKYGYLESRVRKSQFDRWADAEFADPGLVPLGAWEADSLVAASLSRVVGEAWIYSSFFASNDALRRHVASLMLHHVRGLAAKVDGVSFVFAGTQKSGAGASVDAFYLHRGATLFQRPAVLQVNPLARWMLPRLTPNLWRKLRGDFDTSKELPRLDP
jgi:hypothetical protein